MIASLSGQVHGSAENVHAILNIAHPGVAALNLVGMVNKMGVAIKNFRVQFMCRLFSTLLHDTPLEYVCVSITAQEAAIYLVCMS